MLMTSATKAWLFVVLMHCGELIYRVHLRFSPLAETITEYERCFISISYTCATRTLSLSKSDVDEDLLNCIWYFFRVHRVFADRSYFCTVFVHVANWKKNNLIQGRLVDLIIIVCVTRKITSKEPKHGIEYDSMIIVCKKKKKNEYMKTYCLRGIRFFFFFCFSHYNTYGGVVL